MLVLDGDFICLCRDGKRDFYEGENVYAEFAKLIKKASN